ncbi:hypothetical protein [Micavibrio aeruginosavorus]|uniref:Uncharacterized protein n=1 Tax=Micavibrio aeruginosavorus (strain ARL-13) TaxID=856793 RepID=G2KT46_MICAA|nr:hypothetical protein [Micavibrio aeruginosavorus]AEP10590.1 hypothetical protein MICA_2287 [Micavibrio aeruginosavorus ARL-13]
MSDRLSCFPVYFQMVSPIAPPHAALCNLRQIAFYSNPHQIYDNTLI